MECFGSRVASRVGVAYSLGSRVRQVTRHQKPSEVTGFANRIRVRKSRRSSLLPVRNRRAPRPTSTTVVSARQSIAPHTALVGANVIFGLGNIVGKLGLHRMHTL